VESDCVLGHEAAGIVLKVGEGVTDLVVGEFGIFSFSFLRGPFRPLGRRCCLRSVYRDRWGNPKSKRREVRKIGKEQGVRKEQKRTNTGKKQK